MNTEPFAKCTVFGVTCKRIALIFDSQTCHSKQNKVISIYESGFDASRVMLVAFRDEVEKLLRGAVRRNRNIHESQKLLSLGGSAEHPEPHGSCDFAQDDTKIKHAA